MATVNKITSQYLLIITMALAGCSENDLVLTQPSVSKANGVSMVSAELMGYPHGVVENFARSFPQITATEIFKRITFIDSSEETIFFGIEGLNSDETAEIDAIYDADGEFIVAGSEQFVGYLPEAVQVKFNILYQGADIEEITLNGEGEYAVLFALDEVHQEVNLDNTGEFVSLEKILEEDEIPQIIRQAVAAKNVDLPDVEYEEVTYPDDSKSYVVEFENDEGDSISFQISASGKVLQIDFEGPINSTEQAQQLR